MNLRALLRWFKKPPPLPAQRKLYPGPPAFVDCGREITFSATFIVGMTLAELLGWLQTCCSQRAGMDGCGEIPWLPEKLQLASGKEVGMDYVIQEGDVLILGDLALPAPQDVKLLPERGIN